MIENVNNNSSQSEQTIHFVENVRTRNNTYRQKDIILFLHESLDLMTKLIESIRVKLIEHQYRNTVRSPIDIPIAQFVKEVNDRFGNNDDILEAITKKATDLATQIKDKLIDTGADLAETAITFSMSLTGIVSNVSLFFLNSMILGTSVGLITNLRAFLTIATSLLASTSMSISECWTRSESMVICSLLLVCSLEVNP